MNALHNFLNYLTNERQASAHTTDNYQRDILQFADMVLGGSQNWQSVGTDQARQFVIKLQEQQMARNSVLRKISSLRSFSVSCCARKLLIQILLSGWPP